MNLKKGIFILFLLIQYVSFAQPLLEVNVGISNSPEFALLSPTQTIDTLYQIGVNNFKEEKYRESVDILHEALLISEKEPQKHSYLSILLQIGRAHYRMNNYIISQEYVFKAIDEFNDQTPLVIKGEAYSILGTTYYNLGDNNLSHEYRLKSIEIKEILKDSTGIAMDYYDMGSMFFYQNMSEKAHEYYLKSNEIGVEIGNARIVYNTTAALGATYEQMKKLDISLKLNLRSLEIADSLDYETGKAYSLHNIGSNYLEMGDYEKAISYIDRSFRIKRTMNDDWGMIGSRLALGDLYTRTNQYTLAEENLNHALKLAKKIESKGRISDIYMNLSDLYKASGEKDSAIVYLTKFIGLKDSIMNETIAKEMGDRKTQFEFQKKEYEISLLTKDNALLESEQKVNRLNTFMSFGLSAFLLVVCCSFYFLLVKQRKLSESLKEKNREIEKQKGRIQAQNKLLESSNEELKQFAYVASHDLREPLRMIKSYGTLINRRYNDLLDKSGKEFLYFMTDAAQRMDKLLLDILEYSRMSRNTETFEEVSTKDLLISIEVMIANLVNEKGAVLEFELDKFPTIFGRKSQLYRLLQNLITNSIKYNVSPKPKVIIDCVKNYKNYIFSVKDNGIGIPEKDQKKIFEMFHRLHSKEEYEGSGIGLATCKKIVTAHNGNIWVESEEGKGSTFFFSLPFYDEPDLERKEKLSKYASV